MKREIKPGMKFMMPVAVSAVANYGIGVTFLNDKTARWSVLHTGRFDGLTPEGGWPREPFKHGDSVVPVGFPDCAPRTIWGDERDSIICVEYRDGFFKREASEYELAPSK